MPEGTAIGMRSPLTSNPGAKDAGSAAVSSSVPNEFIENHLKQSFAESVRPVGYGLSFLFLFFALAHPYALGQKATPLVIIAILSSIVFALIAFRTEAANLSDGMVMLISLVFVFLVLANTVTHLLLTSDPKQTTNFLLLIVAAGSFYLSRRKLLLVIALIAGAWWISFDRLPSRAEMPHYVFALVTATVIAFLTVALRRRALVAAATSAWEQQQQLALLQTKDEELLKTNLQLEDRVRARTAELEQEIERRRNIERAAFEAEKLAATGRLAATIAHEINNPLESVANLLYLIESNPSLPEETIARAQVAQQELGRVSHIAKQTLSFYREIGKPSNFDVSSALREVAELYEPKARTRKLKLELITKDGGLTIEGYLGEFRQVASNLLLNAIDATPPGGTIRVRTKPSLTNGRPGVRITFADPGAGIQRHLRAKIFQPFFTTKEQRGTGLGLWVALGIVSRHGGNIQLLSSTRPERHGTSVSVWLPVQASEPADTGRRRFEKSGQ
jgi:signal transduction histidine kinase